MVKKNKIAVVIPDLIHGGAQRMLLNLIKQLDPDKHSLFLCVLTRDGGLWDQLPSYVKVVELGRIRYSIINLLIFLWKNKVNVLYSTLGQVNIFLLIFRFLMPRLNFVVRESSIVSEKIKHVWKYPKVWTWLYKCYYRKADKIICQSNYMRDDFMTNFKIPESKLNVIYNFIDREFIDIAAKRGAANLFDREYFNIVVVGRVVHLKGYDRLIDMLSEFSDDKRLLVHIIGEGHCKDSLIERAVEKGVADKVKFWGLQNNPYPFYSNADLFVLSSRQEAMPNCLLEAMACRTNVLAINCPGGTEELMIKTKMKNYLIDKNELANRVSKFYDLWSIGKPVESEAYLNDFSAQAVVGEYEKIFRGESE